MLYCYFIYMVLTGIRTLIRYITYRLQKSYDKEKLFLFPTDITRFSWGTIRELAKSIQAVEVNFACDCDGENDAPNVMKLTSFFGGQPGEKRPKRSNYHMRKKLKHVLPSEL